jgi:hypothetical protein
LPALMDLLRMHVKEGRLPRPRSNEIVVSEPVALNRGLAVGDRIGVPVYERDEFPQLENEDIPAEMVVVGILSASSGQALSAGSPRRGAGQVLSSSDVWLGFASYEYLESHELTSSRPIRLLIVPADGRKNELDTWLEESVASAQTDVTTYGVEYREYRQIVRSLFLVFAVVGSATAIVAAIAMATLDHIFFTQRREEFGILHAVGRSRRWLVLRTVKETGSVVAVAWLIGAAVCVVSLIGAQAVVYAPRGLSLDLLNLVPWMFTLPIPLAVIVGGAGTVARMLFRLDPVAVIERR